MTETETASRVALKRCALGFVIAEVAGKYTASQSDSKAEK